MKYIIKTFFALLIMIVLFMIIGCGRSETINDSFTNTIQEQEVKDTSENIPEGKCLDDNSCYREENGLVFTSLGGKRCFKPSEELGNCIECLENLDCADKSFDNVCDLTAHKCVECVADKDCPQREPRCITTKTEIYKENRCEECISDSDCGQGQYCNEYNSCSSLIYTNYEKIQVGMSKEKILELVGEPEDKQEIVTSYGTSEYWYYGYQKSIQIAFEDGKVSSKAKY